MEKRCKIKCCRLLLILMFGIFSGMLITTLDCFSVLKDNCCVIVLLFFITFIFWAYCSECNDCEDGSKDLTDIINNTIHEAIAAEFKVKSEKIESDLVQAYMNSYIPKNDNEKELLALFNFIKCNLKSKEIGVDKVVEILKILNDGSSGNGKSNGVQGSSTETSSSTP